MSRILKTNDRISRFAEKNLKNKKEFGEDARLAFKRHLNDLKRSEKNDPDFPYIFDPEKAEDIIELANKLTIAEGEGDQTFTCAGFQEFILGSLFGWVHKETGKRRFTDSYVQVARQQGKSVLNAILGIKCSNFDNYNYAQIYCTATKQEQARIVLNEISKFINADADLLELFEIKDYKSEIIAKITNATIRALGRDTKSIDGFRPYLGIVDEYHAHKDNQMYKLLKGGTRKLKHMDKEDNAPYIIWQKEGLLTVTTAAGGIKTDYKTILAHLHNIIDKYDIDLTAIGYDPHNASAFLLDLEDFGCDLVEIKQSARSLNDATIDFQLEVKAHNVEYDKKNKLLTRSMNDAILSEPNSFGEIKIDKMLQKVRIDPCDAIIDAHKLAMGVEVEEITTDQSIEAYLKMFEKAGVKED